MHVFILVIFLILLPLSQGLTSSNTSSEHQSIPHTMPQENLITGNNKELENKQLTSIKITLTLIEERLKRQNELGKDMQELKFIQQGLKIHLANFKSQLSQQEKTQEKQLDGFDGRISDLAFYLGLYGVIITMLAVGLGFSAKSKAVSEAKEQANKASDEHMKQWIDNHKDALISQTKKELEKVTLDLEEQAKKLEQKAESILSQLEEKHSRELTNLIEKSAAVVKANNNGSSKVIDLAQHKNPSKKDDLTTNEWIKKGIDAFSEHNFKEANEAWDNLLLNAEIAKTPLQHSIILMNKGITQGRLKKPGDKLQTLEELITHYKDFHNDKIQVQVAKAMLYKGVAQGELKKLDDEIQTYEELITHYKDFDNEEIQVLVAQAMQNKGISQAEHNKPDDSLQTYEKLITHYKNFDKDEIQVQVARARVNKGFTQATLNKPDDSLQTYEELITHYKDFDNEGIQLQVARAMVNKAMTQEEQNKLDDSLQTNEKLITHYKNFDNDEIQVQVARAMLNKGFTQRKLNKPDDSLQTYEELITLFKDFDNDEIQMQVSKAMLNKGFTQEKLNKPDDSLQTCEELITHFKDFDNDEIQVQVAKAMLNKSFTQGKLNKPDDSLQTCEELITHFKDFDNDEIQVRVAKAMLNKGFTQGTLNKPNDSLQTYEELITHFKDFDNDEIQMQVSVALCNSAEAALLHEVAEQVLQRIKKAESYKISPQESAVMQFIRYLLDDKSIENVFNSIESIPNKKEISWQFNEIRDYLTQFKNIKKQNIQAVVSFFEEHKEIEKLRNDLHF